MSVEFLKNTLRKMVIFAFTFCSSCASLGLRPGVESMFQITDLLKVFDAILPEEMNLLVIARVAFDALSSFHNLTTEGRQAFDKSFPRVTAFIEGERRRLD